MAIGQFTISVQWGPGNYCEKRDFSYRFNAPREADIWSSKDAEIAIWETRDRDGAEWIQCTEGDSVRGWCSAKQVARVIGFMSKAEIANGNTGDARSKLTTFVQFLIDNEV